MAHHLREEERVARGVRPQFAGQREVGPGQPAAGDPPEQCHGLVVVEAVDGDPPAADVPDQPGQEVAELPVVGAAVGGHHEQRGGPQRPRDVL